MSARAAVAAGAFASESELAARWGEGVRGPLRLEDGRALKVVFPGVPGGASGPDYTGAIVEAGDDLLRGDVELHLRASGWRSHGHHLDPAYAGVVLHVVEANDTGALATLGSGGRAIPVLVLRAAAAGLREGFTPPCAFAAAHGMEVAATLERMGARRLRQKAVRVAPLVESAGTGQALFTLLLETLAGAANRAAFARLARELPLAAILERLDRRYPGVDRPFAAAAELKGAAALLALRRAGLRPLASPARRLELAGALVAGLWPGSERGWPAALQEGTPLRLRAPGLGRGMAVELAVNAVLPVALASGAWAEASVEAAWLALPSPGTYGRLKRLEGWLGHGGGRPFASAARLQGGLLLHRDYCTRGMCGRCPLSGA
ncbi:MAG: DUF2851 family protein [Chloroflexi bacterium]|nr:DUF2851 family protein [Chloroflexota bacterium]